MNSLVWILVGTLIIISVWLSQVISQWWLLLALLVSAYLVVTGLTGHCPVKNYLKKQVDEAGKDDADED